MYIAIKSFRMNFELFGGGGGGKNSLDFEYWSDLCGKNVVMSVCDCCT